jgi:hypothetical protein
MAEKSTLMTGKEVPENAKEMEELRASIADQINACGVPFPIRTKKQLADVYPWGTPIKCRHEGKDVSIHDLINNLSDTDFPIKDAYQAAILLTSNCEYTGVK